MACGCGNTINLNCGCTVPVIAPSDNYYTKSEIDEIIENVEISGGCCITEAEVDEKIEAATEDKVTVNEVKELITENVWVENGVLHIGEDRP